MIDLVIKYYELLKSLLGNVFDLRHLYFTLSITVFLLIIELIFQGWHNSSLKKILKFEPSTRIDCISWFVEAMNVFTLFSLVFSFGLCYYFVGFIQKSIDFDFHVSNAILQFAIVFVASDLKGFISHYFFHKSNTLWQLHAFHHSATTFNILTRQRGHFMESEIRRFFDVIPFVIFGAPITTYLFVRFIVEAHQMIIHSSSNSDWGFLGRYVLVSPAAHRIHHSIDDKHFNKNFGITFIFWDMMFNTYHPRVEKLTLGIPNNPYNKGYFKDMITSQILFFKSAIGSIHKRIIKPILAKK